MCRPEVRGRSEDADAGDDGVARRPYSFYVSWRFALLSLLFWSSFNLYTLRANISVAMVCMINNTAVRELQHLSAKGQNDTSTAMWNASRRVEEDQCGRPGLNGNGTAGGRMIEDGPFVWDKPTQGVILSSFFWGYLFTQIPGGWLAYRLGSKWLMGVTMLLTAVLAIVTPVVAAQGGYRGVVAVRVLQGLLGGVWFPAFNSLYARWCATTERSRMFSYTIAGLTMASIVVNPISGVLCVTAGWESIFYLFGGVTLVWGVFWFWLVTDHPDSHRYISDREAKYLRDSLRGEVDYHAQGTKLPIPYKSILLSPVVWAAIMGHTGATWGLYMMLTNLPTFMRELLHLDIKSSGLYSALPYICAWIVMCSAGSVADMMIAKQWLSKVNVRRLMNCMGVGIPAIFLVGMGYVHCSQVGLAVAMLSIGTGFFGFRTSGFGVSHSEIAPQYADFIMGISNTVATIPGIVAPAVIGAITTEQSPGQWQTVFWISLGVQLTGTLIYLVFISGDVQPWARVDAGAARWQDGKPANLVHYRHGDSDDKQQVEQAMM